MDRTALITDNLKLVHKMAHIYSKRSIQDNAIDYDDIYGEGCMGLIKAAEMFDPSKGFKFSTFACRYIAGFILRSIRRKGFVHVPHHVVDVASKIMKNKLEDSTAEEIAERLGYSLKWVQWGLDYLEMRSVSMDIQLKEGEGDAFDNLIPYQEDYSTAFVRDFIDSLLPKQRQVLVMVLDGKDYRTIGNEIGITFQGVSKRMAYVKKCMTAYQTVANGEA